jgi:hypothetical protein
VNAERERFEAEPFSIDVSDEVLTDLRARLVNTRLPDRSPGPAGSNL